MAVVTTVEGTLTLNNSSFVRGAQESAEKAQQLESSMKRVGGAAGGMSEEFRNAGSRMHESAAQAEESAGMFGKLRENLGEIKNIAAGMIVGNVVMGMTAGVGEQLKDVITDTANFGEQTRLLSMKTGMATEQSSGLIFAMKEIGVAPEAATASFTRFSRGLETSFEASQKSGKAFTGVAGALHDAGVQFEDGHGKMLPFNDLLLNVSDKFKEMPDGVEKTALAVQLFGRSGATMLPLLNQGREGIEEAMAAAQKYGLTLSKDNVDQIRQFALAHKQAEGAVEGMRLQVGVLMMPMLTAMIKGFGEGVVSTINFIRSLNGMVDIGGKLGPVMQVVGDVLNMIKNVFLALIKGDPNSAFLAISQEMFNLTGTTDAFHDAITGVVNFLFGTLPQALGQAADKAKELGGAFAGVAGEVLPFISSHKEVQSILVGLAVALGAAKVAMVAYQTYITVIEGATKLWAAAQAALNIVMALNPVVLIVLAVVALIAAFVYAYNTSDTFREKINGLWANIQAFFAAAGAFFSAFGTMVQSVLQGAGSFFDQFGTKVRDVLNQVGQFFSNLGTSIHNIVDAVSTWLQTWWPLLFAILAFPIFIFVSVVRSNWDTIQNVIQTVVTTIKNVVTTIFNAIAAFIGFVHDAIVSRIQAAWNMVSSTVSQLLGNIWSVVQSIWNSISSFIGGIMDGIGTAVSSALNGVFTTFQGLATNVGNLLGGLVGTATSQASSIGQGIINGIWNGISGGWSWLQQQVANLAQSLLNAAKAALGIKSPSSAFAEVGNNIVAGLLMSVYGGIGAVQQAGRALAGATMGSFGSVSIPSGGVATVSGASSLSALGGLSAVPAPSGGDVVQFYFQDTTLDQYELQRAWERLESRRRY